LPRCMELALALGGEPIQREKDVLHRWSEPAQSPIAHQNQLSEWHRFWIRCRNLYHIFWSIDFQLCVWFLSAWKWSQVARITILTTFAHLWSRTWRSSMIFDGKLSLRTCHTMNYIFSFISCVVVCNIL
jgi:hypothetical protein